MARAEHEVRIARPIEEVFDFLADGSNNSNWQPRTFQTSRVEEGLGVGTSFRQSVRHPFGFSVASNYRLTVFERPVKLALVSTSGGPIHPEETHVLEAVGAGQTRLRTQVAYQVDGIVRLARPLLALLHPLFAWEASWTDNITAGMIASSRS
jgi:uncharacterized protein YndB with AHSA1/START domain